MTELISIGEACGRKRNKLRLPIWSNPADHIELHITEDGLLGPWISLWSEMNERCGFKNPHKIIVSQFDLSKKEWLPYQMDTHKVDRFAVTDAEEQYVAAFDSFTKARERLAASLSQSRMIISIGKIMKFRKKPVVIDAMQFVTNNEPGDVNMNAIVAWINHGKTEDDGLAWHNGTDIHIPTLEGIMTANVKDWIICGVKGEFYPVKPDIFEATYEAVNG